MEFIQPLLSVLFPSRCLLCQHSADTVVELCAGCLAGLPHNTRCCQRCALPLAVEAGKSLICGRCIKQPPAFDYAYSLFSYQDEIIKLVHQLKFSEKITYARSIGELLRMRLQAEAALEKDKPDCLLPVPLHQSRLRQRGFNQSIEISRVISKKLAIPIECHAVVRQRSTDAQTGLDAKQRRRNMKGAFKMAAEFNAGHVLIVDDVVTTGATTNELAKLLKKNGVRRVGVLSIARAPVKG